MFCGQNNTGDLRWQFGQDWSFHKHNQNTVGFSFSVFLYPIFMHAKSHCTVHIQRMYRHKNTKNTKIYAQIALLSVSLSLFFFVLLILYVLKMTPHLSYVWISSSSRSEWKWLTYWIHLVRHRGGDFVCPQMYTTCIVLKLNCELLCLSVSCLNAILFKCNWVS